MSETAVNNAKYRRLRANGVPHRQAVAMAALSPSADFAALPADTTGLVSDSDLTAALATLSSTTATDAELAAAVAAINTALAIRLPQWQPNTFYAANAPVLNPSGYVATAKVDFTSGSTYNGANWNLVKTTTAQMTDGSVTEVKFNLPAGQPNGTSLLKDNTQGGGMRWGTPSVPSASNTLTLAKNSTSGSRAADAAANDAALAAWRLAPTSRLRFLEPGVYPFSANIECTGAREIEIAAGVVLEQTKTPTGSTETASAHGLLVSGSFGTSRKLLTADAARFSSTIRCAAADAVGLVASSRKPATSGSVIMLYSAKPNAWAANTTYAAGTLVLNPSGLGATAKTTFTSGTTYDTTNWNELGIASPDRIHTGHKYMPCQYAEVVAIDTTTVPGTAIITLDQPLFRQYSTVWGAGFIPITLHPELLVHGGGAVRMFDPDAQTAGNSNKQFWAYLARMQMLRGLTWAEVELYQGGGAGLELAGVWGGDLDINVHHLIDQDTTNFGYGVMTTGPSRDIQIRGVAHHCRHAFTTNFWSGPTRDTLGINGDNLGDPSFIDVALETYACYSQEIDTHEGGHHLTLDVSASGGNTTAESGGQVAVNVRSTETTVKGLVASGYAFATGSGNGGISVDFTTLADPNARCRIRDARIFGGYSGIRFGSDVITQQLDIDKVRMIGTKYAVLMMNSSGTVKVRGMSLDAAALGSLAYAFTAAGSGTGTWAGIIDAEDLTMVGYTANHLTNITSVAAVQRILTAAQKGRIATAWDGTGAAPTRPLIPAGEWVVVCPAASASSVTPNMLVGDLLDTY